MRSYALFLLASIATTVSAACEREDLKELAIQYVDAQATGSVDEMPPFIDVATVSSSQSFPSPLRFLLDFRASWDWLGQLYARGIMLNTMSHLPLPPFLFISVCERS